MDPLSHSIVGTSVAIIALNTPALQDKPILIPISFISIIIASNLPDIDVVAKLFGNKTYINQHRGVTHSIIVFNILALILNLIVNVFLKRLGFQNNILLPWILLGTWLHVITDLFNNYGVKIFWPLKDKWYSINATYTIDTYIIASNLIGVILYLLIPAVGSFFVLIMLLSNVLYLTALTIYRRYKLNYIKNQIDNCKRVYLASKPIPHQWKFVAQTYDGIYHIGTLHGNTITIFTSQKKQKRIDDDLYEIIRNNKNLKIFLKFAKVYNWDIKQHPTYTEVRVKDLSYCTKINNNYVYLFNSVLYIDKDDKITHSYVGFTTGDDYLYKMVEQPISIKKIFKKLNSRKAKL